MRRSDPIVGKIRAIRSELAARCGYGVEEIFRRTRQRQVRSGLAYVRYPARRPTLWNDMRASGADRQQWRYGQIHEMPSRGVPGMSRNRTLGEDSHATSED